MRALQTLVRKEFRQIFRDPGMLRIIFAVPLVQLLVFSYAANTDLHNVPVSALDQDQTVASRRLVEAFFHCDVFVPGPIAHDPRELKELLANESARVALWIPKGFTKDLAEGRTPQVGITVDGQNSSVAGRASGYAQVIVARETQRMLRERGFEPETASGGVARVTGITRFFYNPQLESRFFMVPGILVLLITVISSLLTGMAVVREKEIGTLEQLLVSPLRPFELVVGKTIPFVVVSFFEFCFAGVVAVLWFHLPLEGSIPLLALSGMAYLLVTLGVGLLASTLSQTQQQAMLTVWFFLVFGILMSGFFYPVENMPRWAQWISAADPVRYIMDIVRGIFLKGSGFLDLWRDLAILTGMGLFVFGSAAQRFQKRLS
ncbi:MAG TPA: ABC transporter permease [Candidatus Krumholzibacteria bacterium]|nr:ABC transporter permease [Candidatus Krumholzibacteria bacterium]